MTEALVHEPSDDNLANIVDELSQKLVSGNSDAIEAILAEHPNEAERLRALLPTLRVLVEIGSSPIGQNNSKTAATERVSPELLHPQILGDFRILHEIGRGGMGVVFEAEQISLRRRVALKVLPTASTLDPRSLQRFRNEAQAAASLHHSNIVPIHGVGCERGVHYYAMQYIDGLTIAEVIAKLRESSKLDLSPQVQHQSRIPDVDSRAQMVSREKQAAETEVMAALSTEKPSNSGAWFRRLAEHMAQVADALHHAHELGVMHRDIKPANLMLDRLGRIWVTDFGLARVEGADNLTMTGDLVGTLRYMSPEQSLAKRLGVDHRSDIYSLGITLYELLTLNPAFAGEGRQKLLQQLASEEPKSLRKQNPSIPRDLETIVMKATQKSPSERYQTAEELAADLRRFADDRHIVARRPSLSVQAKRLAKRHRGIVSTVAVMLLLVIVGYLGWAYDYNQRVMKATRLVNDALQESTRRRVAAQTKEDDLVGWEQATASALRAEILLENGMVEEEIAKRVRNHIAELKLEHAQARDRIASSARDQKMLRDLGRAREELLATRMFDERAFCSANDVAFRDYGIDLTDSHQIVNALETRLRGSFIRDELVSALIAWAIFASEKSPDGPSKNSILAFTEQTSMGQCKPWQTSVIAALQRDDPAELKAMASSWDKANLSPDAAFCISLILDRAGDRQAAIAVIQASLPKNPGDFFLNAFVGYLLTFSEPPQGAMAISYLNTAIALRPDAALPRGMFGIALTELINPDQYVSTFNEAARHSPTYAQAHSALAAIMQDQYKLHEEAIVSIREAIRLKPNWFEAHHVLGNCLRKMSKNDEAIAAYRETIRLKPSYADAHFNMGIALGYQGKYDEAIASYREAIGLKPTFAAAHCELAGCLARLGDFSNALMSARRGHELGSKIHGWYRPTEKDVLRYEGVVKLIEQYESIVNNGDTPLTPLDRVHLAEFAARTKGDYKLATRLFEEAFSEPELADDIKSGHRYCAACCALLVCQSTGVSLPSQSTDDAERNRLTHQALVWIRADLDALRISSQTKNPGKLIGIRNVLSSWKNDPDLAGICNDEAVKQLSTEDQELCRKIWADHALLLRQLALLLSQLAPTSK
jgi:serine/threonine protein kinase/Flp pilus assembly protein TadD